MPRIAKELTPAQIKNLKPEHDSRPTKHTVGGVAGLLFQVTPNGARSWLLRTTVGNKRREYGLGAYPEISLGQAKERAREAKSMIRQGQDPSEVRRKFQREIIQLSILGKTFFQVVQEFTPIKQEHLSKGKYRNQWGESIENHAMPYLGGKLINEIDVEDVLAVLKPIWRKKTATADKLRRKLNEVFDYAITMGYREGANPAGWSGRLKMSLPSVSQVSGVRHYPAVQVSDIARFWGALTDREGNSAAALRFQLLTATRSGAVRFMTWGELSDDLSTWIVQPGRTSSKIAKTGAAKRVPLSPLAQSILKEVPRLAGSDLVFWSPSGKVLSDAALGSVMRKIHEEDMRSGGQGFVDAHSGEHAVPHGFRSTFKDWSLEIARADPVISELALWHSVGSKVEQAYARADMVDDRRVLMKQWAQFVSGGGENQNSPKIF